MIVMCGLAVDGGSPWHEGTRVQVGEQGQSVPQWNREGSTLCEPSVHPQPPLRCNTAAEPRVGCLAAVALCAFVVVTETEIVRRFAWVGGLLTTLASRGSLE